MLLGRIVLQGLILVRFLSLSVRIVFIFTVSLSFSFCFFFVPDFVRFCATFVVRLMVEQAEANSTFSLGMLPHSARGDACDPRMHR